MTAPEILVLGNVNIDLVLGEIDGWPPVGTEVLVDRSEMRAGGSAGNTALALTGLGVRHRLIASTGDDPNGTWLQGCFDPGCCDWRFEPGATTLTIGIVHRGGDRAFFTTPGHLGTVRTAALIERLPPAPHAAACAILSGGFLMPEVAAGTAKLLKALRTRGWRTALDPGWPPAGWGEAARRAVRAWLPATDYALLNGEEIKGLSGLNDLDAALADTASQLRSDQALVVKLGPDGARAAAGGQHVVVSARQVPVVDTVGAGDTFNAAFLARTVAGGTLEDAVNAGVAAATRAISTFPRRYGP